MSNTPLLLKVDDLQGLLGLGRTKIYDEIRSGRLRSITVGRRRLIPATEVERWIELQLEGVQVDGDGSDEF